MNKNLKDIEAETPVKFVSSAGSVELNTLRMGFQAGYGVINRIESVREKAEAKNEIPVNDE